MKWELALKKIVLNRFFWPTFMLVSFLVPIARSVLRDLPKPPPPLFSIPNFTLTDENGSQFGSSQLKNKIYIANFFFTSCPTICVEQGKKLQHIQKRLRGLGDKILILSFSVDSKTDVPSKLFKWARQNHANPYVWKFLTGKEEDVSRLLNSGFRVASTSVTGKNTNLFDLVHSEKLILVDDLGSVRGIYSSDKDSINKMLIDVGLLVNLNSNHLAKR
jgi:protein SCO1/2